MTNETTRRKTTLFATSSARGRRLLVFSHPVPMPDAVFVLRYVSLAVTVVSCHTCCCRLFRCGLLVLAASAKTPPSVVKTSANVNNVTCPPRIVPHLPDDDVVGASLLLTRSMSPPLFRGSSGSFRPSLRAACSYVAPYDVEPHSACLLPNPNLRIRRSGVTPLEKELIVSLHNVLRSRVAQGLERRGRGAGQPAASYMREMTWDDELAMIAQSWASQGYDGRRLGPPMPENAHDCNTCRSVARFEYVGQNVAWASKPRSKDGQLLPSSWAHHIMRLYDEVDHFDPKKVQRFSRNENRSHIGHYTQIVWAKSYKVGCGAAYYDCSFYSKKRKRVSAGQCLKYVCNYGPAGNFIGEPVYPTRRGKKSLCLVKSKAYPGLCSASRHDSSFFDIPLMMGLGGGPKLEGIADFSLPPTAVPISTARPHEPNNADRAATGIGRSRARTATTVGEPTGKGFGRRRKPAKTTPLRRQQGDPRQDSKYKKLSPRETEVSGNQRGDYVDFFKRMLMKIF